MSKFHTPHISSEQLDRINPLLLPLPWLVVVLLVIVFAVMKYTGGDDKEAAPQAAVKVFPQIFLTEVDMRQYDQNGALHYQLNTPLVRHFQATNKASREDYTLVTTPAFVLSNNPQKPAWHISAQEGRSEDNGRWFTLSQNVVAQNSSKAQGEITISTEELRLNSQDQFAETGKAVTMRSAKSQVKALGMHADIKREHIELLSHVKGTYEP